MNLLIALLQALVLFAVAPLLSGSFASPARGCITAADRGYCRSIAIS